MIRLEKKAFEIATPFVKKLSCHTLLPSIISGKTPGVIYVNHPADADCMVAQFRHRTLIAGQVDKAKEIDLRTFFLNEVASHCEENNVPLFRLAASSPAWIQRINDALADLHPIRQRYHCYRYSLPTELVPIKTPKGFELREVNENLIKETFEGKDVLLEEMCSERESIEVFLRYSFGVCAFSEGRLAGWCLSEYNHEDRCEVGIATLPPHQQKGLATAMTSAFFHLARQHAIRDIVWHCYQSNTASIRTALKAGFHLMQDKEVLELFLDPTVNLGVQGNLRFEEKAYGDALSWYQKALETAPPPPWIPWNAACAAAQSGREDLAFDLLTQAIDAGFNDLDRMVQSPYLAGLKGDPLWAVLIDRLNQKLPS